LKLTNKIENSYAIIVPHEKDVSFMNDWGSSSTSNDIVISRGFHFNDQTTNFVIQKPREVDEEADKIVIPYETDLTNIESRLINLEDGGNYEYLLLLLLLLLLFYYYYNYYLLLQTSFFEP
jgi:hypothetical protein